MKRSIVAIVVTYNPNLSQLEESILRISKEVKKIIICNNSMDDLFFKKDIFNLEVLNFKENLGIAKAQNIGMRKAFEEGSDYIIQFDQDSLMDEGMIVRLLETYKNLLKTGKKIGLLGPIEYDRDTLEMKKINKFRKNKILDKVFKVKLIISSGCIISKEIYQKFGEMKEEWFIDLIDFEYCWRLENKGYGIYLDEGAKLAHRLGDGKVETKLKLKVPLGAAFRHYYQFRNILYSLSLDYVPLNWKIKSLIKLFIKYTFYPLILEDGKERKKYMKKGLKDFYMKRLGKLDDRNIFIKR